MPERASGSRRSRNWVSRGCESPGRLGRGTLPVLSSLTGLCRAYCVRQGRDRADTPPHPPGVSSAAGRDPDRQRSGSGSPEEGRGAHSSDGGLPPVELPAAPAGWTCPCMDGGGGRLGGPGLWTEHPQGCPRGPCARKGQALTLLPVRLPPVPSPPFWAPSWTILGGLLSAPRLSLPQAAGGLRTAQHAWFRPGAPCPPSAGPAGARRAPGG